MSHRIFYPHHQKTGKKSARFDRTRGLRIKKSLLLFFIVLFSGILFSLLRHSALQVRAVEIRGTETIPGASIQESVLGFLSGSYSFFIPKSSYFFISPRALEEQIEKNFFRVSEASVAKIFPDFLKVTIKERKPWAIFCQKIFSREERNSSANKSSCFYIDSGGFAYENAPESSGTLLIRITGDFENIRIGSYAIDSKTILAMNALSERIKKRIGFSVIGYELYAGAPSEIRVLTDRGFTIIFKKEDDFDAVFEVLRRVLDEEIKNQYNRLEYIDLRFGSKVFYKYK